MLTFFRRLINSRVGVIVTFVVLGIIALAFAAADITGVQSTTGTVSGADVATVGGEKIGLADLRQRVESELQAAREQSPTLDMAQLVASGGVEAILDRLIDSRALAAFGHDQGMVASKALVDSELRAIPGLLGPTGKFDQSVYERLLSQRRVTDAQVRDDIARGLVAQHLTLPTIGATQVPEALARPYASLLLERRSGEIGFIPASAVGAGAAPTAQEIQNHYGRNLARYTVPERRVMRFARVTPDSVRAQATPTDAEIAQAYASDRARFAPTQKRSITQVTVLDQAAATALATRVRGGASLTDAARGAGLEPQTVTSVDKAAYTAKTGAAVADAAFAAPQGGVVGPVRGSIGFVVAKVDTVEQVAGKTLPEARAEIAEALTQQKTAEALGRMSDALNDAIADNANFNELATDQKLASTTTAPLTVAGLDPDSPATAVDPTLAPLLQAAFAAEQGDAPTLVPLGQDGGFAIVGLDRVIPSAPRPLTEVRDTVARDFMADRANRAARALANQIAAKASKGLPLGKAMAEAGRALPPVRPLAAARAQLAANPRGAPPPLALLFAMASGTAKTLEAPEEGGWFVVKLNTITPGDASKQPQIITATRRELGRVMGQEYVRQFTQAARNAVGVKRNEAAIAQLKRELTGQGGSNPQ